MVHVSITNPAKTSRLPYFRGKAILEETLIHSSLSHAIIRPTVIFGDEDILINNIAWLLRHFPVFPIFGTASTCCNRFMWKTWPILWYRQVNIKKIC